jgi:hypothetical protein
MNTVATLENPVLSPNAGQPTKPKNAAAALSSPKSIDYVAMAEAVAKRKASIGTNFAAKKGKQSLFTGVCAMVLSTQGKAKTDKLPEAEIASINAAIADFWKLQANRILSYGRMVSATYDKPKAVFTEALEVESVVLNATLRAERDPKDKAEERLYTLALVKSAKDRMDYMLENLAKFERAEMTAQKTRIESLEKHYASLIEPAAVKP